MFTLTKKDQRGFTIVELLIVIVVIGILAALVVTTYGGIQAKARDSERKSDLAALQTQLEAYYANNGFYPALDDLNSGTWRDTNMKSLDDEALKAPNGTGAMVASESTDAAKAYGYQATTGGSGSTTACAATAGTECTGYTLSAALEAEDGVYKKESLE